MTVALDSVAVGCSVLSGRGVATSKGEGWAEDFSSSSTWSSRRPSMVWLDSRRGDLAAAGEPKDGLMNPAAGAEDGPEKLADPYLRSPEVVNAGRADGNVAAGELISLSIPSRYSSSSSVGNGVKAAIFRSSGNA